MAIINQTTGLQRQWSDWLPYVVCVTALLTLISATVAGVFSQRLGTLAFDRKKQQAQTHQAASQELNQAKAIWERKEVALEKELLSAKLKIKAEMATSASIRKRLVKLQKDFQAMKKTADGQSVKTAAQTVPAATPQPAITDAPKNAPSTLVPTAAPTSAAPVKAIQVTTAPVAVPSTKQPESAAPVLLTTPATPVETPLLDTATPRSTDTETPPAAVNETARKISEALVKPAAQPIELAPPASADDTLKEVSILKVPDAEAALPSTQE